MHEDHLLPTLDDRCQVRAYRVVVSSMTPPNLYNDHSSLPPFGNLNASQASHLLQPIHLQASRFLNVLQNFGAASVRVFEDLHAHRKASPLLKLPCRTGTLGISLGGDVKNRMRLEIRD